MFATRSPGPSAAGGRHRPSRAGLRVVRRAAARGFRFATHPRPFVRYAAWRADQAHEAARHDPDPLDEAPLLAVLDGSAVAPAVRREAIAAGPCRRPVVLWCAEGALSLSGQPAQIRSGATAAFRYMARLLRMPGENGATQESGERGADQRRIGCAPRHVRAYQDQVASTLRPQPAADGKPGSQLFSASSHRLRMTPRKTRDRHPGEQPPGRARPAANALPTSTRTTTPAGARKRQAMPAGRPQPSCRRAPGRGCRRPVLLPSH